MEFTYHSLQEIVEMAENRGMKLSELVLMEQANVLECSQQEVLERMREQYKVMKQAELKGQKKNVKSTSGLTGGDAYKIKKAIDEGRTLSGSFLAGALMRATAVSELNAAMGKIVAAPTAGSCGILPAALITMQEEKGVSEDECIMALLTASAIGMIIANNASIAGAEGGCQAECGAASAMAAAAIVELSGGTPTQCAHAVAIALKNIMGLVCDPVAGLVEIPCVKRNASGVANAITSAELVLCGVKSAIPTDEVIEAMAEVGNKMDVSLRETAEGGLANCPTAKLLCRKVFACKETE
ncbi:MAG: L-serine ammonia-lyase, iron-sulfur-dependent, subunit alpha [Lachnospiraceae bacterium]|jgi:L-serine dehydratase|nr:L-serine ammonia-lyase, iron-sulfur-dependent, subunit alpha [Lachnospiraceae bacterium]